MWEVEKPGSNYVQNNQLQCRVGYPSHITAKDIAVYHSALVKLACILNLCYLYLTNLLFSIHLNQTQVKFQASQLKIINATSYEQFSRTYNFDVVLAYLRRCTEWSAQKDNKKMIKPTEPLDSQQRSQEMKNIVIVLRKSLQQLWLFFLGRFLWYTTCYARSIWHLILLRPLQINVIFFLFPFFFFPPFFGFLFWRGNKRSGHSILIFIFFLVIFFSFTRPSRSRRS